ncbi:MAG TPA: DUF2249 domain-containing protein [Casimicrobiaceae bacterium]|nr:DUF2249 domain-containing protein [Casimicrobiaceae bacterium]
MTTTATPATLDVRSIVPRERHPLIFRTFDALAPGESLVLVNDHDPKPLYYQFKAESTAEFTWEYLEQGPEVWRVAIGKAGAAPTAVAEPRGCQCNH